MTQLVVVREEFVDTGTVIHRRLVSEYLSQPFTVESCQDDQQKGPADDKGRRADEPLVVKRALMRKLILDDERRGCSHCRPTVPFAAPGVLTSTEEEAGE